MYVQYLFFLNVCMCMYVYIMYLSVVVLGSSHDLDESDGIHENLAQQKNVETVHTELNAYTYIHIVEKRKLLHKHTYSLKNCYIHTYIHAYIPTHTYIHTNMLKYIYNIAPTYIHYL